MIGKKEKVHRINVSSLDFPQLVAGAGQIKVPAGKYERGDTLLLLEYDSKKLKPTGKTIERWVYKVLRQEEKTMYLVLLINRTK